MFDFSLFPTNSDGVKQFGWAGPKAAKEAWDKVKNNFDPFKLEGKSKKKSKTKRFGSGNLKKRFLWEVVRKVVGHDLLNYAQQAGSCFVAGTKVLMANGSLRNIEFVKVGDEVITHKNNIRVVKNTFKRSYTGNLSTIYTKGHYLPITCTHDHKFVTYSNESLYEYKWIESEKIKPGIDNVVVPFGIQNVDYQYIQYNDKKIIVDEEFAYIIGLYLAEGGASGEKLKDDSYSYQKVRFCLGSHEENVADDIIKRLKLVFGVDGVKRYHGLDRHSLYVDVCDYKFAAFIKKIIPGNVYSKRVPNCIINSPSNVKMECLRGWIEGDGYEGEYNIQGCSVSYDMIYDFYHISISCGLKPNVNFNKKAKHQNVKAARLNFYGTSKQKILNNQLPERDNARYSNIGLIREIKKITYEHKTCDVFCIEVDEDNSFIANGLAVHNCVSEAARSACNFLGATQILLAGKSEKFKESYAPYHYGCMRVFIGAKHGTEFGYNDDGGIGSYMAESFQEYGNLFADTPGIPEYTGQASIARKFGYRPGPSKELVTLGKQHLIKKVARITSWDDYVDAITNGYPIHFCSNLSWTMMPNSKGYHDQTNEGWAHALMHMGVDDEDSTGFCEILNSWADCHGRLKNTYTGEALPVGVIRSKKSVIARALEDEDVEAFALSDMDGFYERKKEIDKALFDLFGN